MPKPQTPNPGAVCVFSAMVLGRRRHTVIRLRKKDQTLDGAELLVMNTRKAYDSFYQGATDAEYDATLTDRRLQITRRPRIIQEEGTK